MRRNELLDRVRHLVAEVTRARFDGGLHAKLTQAQGYADGYMRALLDAGLVDQAELLEVIGAARRDVVSEGPGVARTAPASAARDVERAA